MDKKIVLDKVLEYLVQDKSIEIPEELSDKIELWKELVKEVDLSNIPSDVFINEDKFLRLDLINRKLTDGEKVRTIDNTLDSDIKYSTKIALWQGDITTMYADVLVNSTTEDMLGCNLKVEGTLDNAIFTRGGMRLRKKCMEVMQGDKLKVTEVLVTRAYNLPSDFIIHVVTPKVEGELIENKRIELGMSYSNVLECARNNMAKIIVLPCIGTGTNNFPKKEAAMIALKSVEEFLDKYEKEIDKIIFNVYDEENYNIYKELLSGE